MVMDRKYINELSKIKLNEKRYVACIGFFDGIHKGHQALIEKTTQLAKEKNLKSMLITFDPDPWSVLNKSSNVKHITPLKRKQRLIEDMGIDTLIILKFNSDFSQLSPDNFVHQVLMGLGVVELVVGSDFKFGFKGQGNVELLKHTYDHLITTHEITIKENDQVKIGTTQITQTILNGAVDKTIAFLGRPYEISGFIIDGRKVGRTLGFPTANIKVEDEYVIPKVGVYAGTLQVKGKTYMSVVNIGYNPTVNHRDDISIESYILDFDQDIYGEVVHQSFVKRLRDEMKFDSVEDLVAEMQKDVKKTRELLEKDFQ